MTLHYRTLGVILVVSDVLPSLVHPVISHSNWIWLYHIHLYQILFSQYWSCRSVIDEKELILWSLNVNFNLAQWFLVILSEPSWVTVWNSYNFFLLLIIRVFLFIASFINWTIISGITIRIYFWPQSRHWFIWPPTILRRCLVGPSSNQSKPFYQRIVRQWSFHSGKYSVHPIYMLVKHHGEWYIFHPWYWLLHIYLGPP